MWRFSRRVVAILGFDGTQRTSFKAVAKKGQEEQILVVNLSTYYGAPRYVHFKSLSPASIPVVVTT